MARQETHGALDRVRKVMRVFQGERSCRTTAVPSSRKLWRALREVDTYLRGQSSRLVNYAKRYRAGLRVGTSLTEGTANFLVNRRMNKAQLTHATPPHGDQWCFPPPPPLGCGADLGAADAVCIAGAPPPG
jgi:hypothetical protein